MHGRIKVRTTEEQQLQKHKEQQKKLAAYKTGLKQILASRNVNDYDPACFQLSGQLLGLNPDIYTLWNFRKEVTLLEINSKGEDGDSENISSFCENELRLTEQCLLSNPKSYGSWHHRYWILTHHPAPDWQKEFNLCNKYLSMDDRNFHVWDYRRLLVNKIGITLPEEIAFSTERINVNFSNYSSWHYRSTLDVLAFGVKNELDLIQNAVFTDPSDTSAWFYLRWILDNPVFSKSHSEFLENLKQLEELEPDCKWVVIAKCWLSKNLASDEGEDIIKNGYIKLIKLDPMRKGYYNDCLKETILKS